jgi:DMSO/TMAO reductase YedYZ molybdopterin-dependent catalytic subunit
MTRIVESRRGFLVSSGIGMTGLALAGCDRLGQSASVRSGLAGAERLTLASQRLLLRGQPLAREYAASDISTNFPSNGTSNPTNPEYQAHLAAGFRDWRLQMDGLVAMPTSYSLAELRRLPSRTQITRQDCVEGWSAIARWTGVPLGLLLQAASPAVTARYVIFHCADSLNGASEKGDDEHAGRYYESIDLTDAFHAQTILAYAMNDRPLPVGNGAPLRLRVERQLGYKSAKYLMRVEVTDRLDRVGDGKGGYWEDRGYEWYAGI